MNNEAGVSDSATQATTDDDYLTPPPVRRFPVMRAVARSYELMFACAPAFARSAMVWVALCLLGVGAIILLSLAGAGRSSGTAVFLPALSALVSLLTSAGAAHAWHRVVLRDQWATGPLLDVSRLLHYLGLVCALVFGVILLPIAIVNLIMVRTTTDLATIVVIVAAVVAPIMSAGRLSLVLPAAAIGQQLSFVGAWQAMEGNALRFLGGALLGGVPPAIASFVVLGVVENFLLESGWVFSAVYVSWTILFWFFMVGLATTYLSLAFRFFVQKRDQMDSGNVDALREAFR